jgi:hypothetical protein
MIVVSKMKGNSYILAELNGAISKTRYAMFRITPSYPCKSISINLDNFLQHPEPAEADSSDTDSSGDDKANETGEEE